MAVRKSRKQDKQITFGAWLGGTRWGLRWTISIIVGATAIITFVKLGGDIGLTRYLLAHRGYVDDEILDKSAPLRNGVTDIKAQLAIGRLNELEKQLLDNDIQKFKVRGTPAEVPLNAQSDKMRRERDDILRLLEAIQRTPSSR